MSISPLSLAGAPAITNVIEVTMCDTAIEGIIVVFSDGSIKMIAARDLGKDGLDKLELTAKNDNASITVADIIEEKYCGIKS